MRITADDMRAIIFLIKRLMTGILIGGRYIIAGQVAVEANVAATQTLTTNTGSVKSSVSKRRIKQLPPIVIDENVYEVPAMVRLKKINLEKWQAENLKPRRLDTMIKEHFAHLESIGLKPSSLYFDV